MIIVNVILEKLQKEIIIGKTACMVIGAVTFTFLTVLGAFIRIPLLFTPVPITAQTFFVFLAGLCLGKKWASVSQIGYLLLGVGGLAVFAGGSGILYLTGPTGGYLLGFIACSWIIGRLIELKPKLTFAWVVFSLCLGSVALYLLGIIHLMLVTKVNVSEAVYMGFLPFVPGLILKMIFAALFFWKFKHRIRNIFSLI